jgi:hypothetical protein
MLEIIHGLIHCNECKGILQRGEDGHEERLTDTSKIDLVDCIDGTCARCTIKLAYKTQATRQSN